MPFHCHCHSFRRVDEILQNCHRTFRVNSLAPGIFERNFIQVFFKLMLWIDGRGIPCEISVTWVFLDLTDDEPTLVQVRPAASHYLSQCWPDVCSHVTLLGCNELNKRVWHKAKQMCWTKLLVQTWLLDKFVWLKPAIWNSDMWCLLTHWLERSIYIRYQMATYVIRFHYNVIITDRWHANYGAYHNSEQ